jgi:hypothetical protein
LCPTPRRVCQTPKWVCPIQLKHPGTNYNRCRKERWCGTASSHPNRHRVFPAAAMACLTLTHVCLTFAQVCLTLAQVCLTLAPSVSNTYPRTVTGAGGRSGAAPRPLARPISPEQSCVYMYRRTSLTRKRNPRGPYSRPMPKVLGGS